MRLPFLNRSSRQIQQAWENESYIWLENISNEHVLLRLPSGDLRLDMKRSLRFRPEILDQPQVQALIEADKLALRR